MKLNFQPAGPANRGDLEALRPFPEQAGFIESVRDCLAEADDDTRWRPVGVYDDQTLVGFAMYGCFAEPEGRVWLDRLLIDRAYQGGGYGGAAVVALLERLRREYGPQTIYLSVYGENRGAIRLYEKAGFSFNGELDAKGERVMVWKPEA